MSWVRIHVSGVSVSSADLWNDDSERQSLQNETQNNQRQKDTFQRQTEHKQTWYYRWTHMNSSQRHKITTEMLNDHVKMTFKTRFKTTPETFSQTCNLILNWKASLLSSQYSPLCSTVITRHRAIIQVQNIWPKVCGHPKTTVIDVLRSSGFRVLVLVGHQSITEVHHSCWWRACPYTFANICLFSPK